jgi:hypothetical protein
MRDYDGVSEHGLRSLRCGCVTNTTNAVALHNVVRADWATATKC